MEEFKQYWIETFAMKEARWIVAITGLIVCVAVAYYVAKLFRDMALGNKDRPTNYISDFQRLREEGKLNDDEYSRLARAIPSDALGDQSTTADPNQTPDVVPQTEVPDFTLDRTHENDQEPKDENKSAELGD
ncbi:MAG: hypothetical protein ACI87E_003788 [Mariniblastus sp.]|jgi:hypothetical protein